jgi:serine/threonine protein kinase
MSDVDRENASIPPIGAVLAGKYEVERVLGAGAMGVVVAARHRLLRKTVALKLISGSREARSTAVARFTREARAIAGLASDHIVRILDFGLDEGVPFMVMQYLPGRDLASEVRARGGKLPQVEAVDYVIHACAGLAVAHAAGIVHRDIKPENLLLTARASGEALVVIVDFGISKTLNPQEELSLTVSQTTLGSPLYMSPEQIRDSKTVDARTDVWSLGVVLQFLLTGKPAFTAGDASGVLAAVIADQPARLRADAPEIAADLEEVVLRCLEKKPAFRYESTAVLAQALAPYASEAGAALARTIPAVRVRAAQSPLAPESASALVSLDPGTFSSTTRGPGASSRSAGRRWIAFGFTTVGLCIAGAAVTLRSPEAAGLGTGVMESRAPAATQATASFDPPTPRAPEPAAPASSASTTVLAAPSPTLPAPLRALAPPPRGLSRAQIPIVPRSARPGPGGEDSGMGPSDPFDTAE